MAGQFLRVLNPILTEFLVPQMSEVACREAIARAKSSIDPK